MNLLLINHYAGSPRHGMEFRPYYLAREWARMGHKVQIVAGSYSHIRAQQPQMPPARHRDETIDGIDYRWYATPSYRGNGVGRARSMLSFLWHLWRDGKALAQDFNPDVVIASSTYPMDIWPARRMARMAGAKLVYEVHDLWPLSPIELGGMSRWHPFIVWVQMAEDHACRHADKVVSMLPKALEHLRSRGMAAEKFACVPNGVDAAEWADPAPLPPEVARQLERMRESRLPIVAYVGTHGLANALDVLLDAAALLRGKAQVLLVGPGPERERLRARVAREQLDNVSMLPSVPKQSVPTLLAGIDIAYIGWRPNALYRFGISPNKLMDYMMAARPVVHSVRAGNDPVAQARCGVTVPPDDPVAVANAIEQLAALSASQRQALGLAGRAYVMENHTYPVLARRFLAAIQASGVLEQSA